ncbi:MAG: helix-turn-helix domain-containing protein [Rickettsiales bacterium]|nr:helix-turn-helix domain-containing protein [Rickettsiales bacterium]
MAKNRLLDAAGGTNIYVLIGDRVRARRTELGVSVDSLAAWLGIPADMLSDIEAGRLKVNKPLMDGIIVRLSTTRIYLLTGLGESEMEKRIAELDHAIRLHGLFLSLSGRRREMLKETFKRIIGGDG